ncbi:MAG: GNAT family N-acetyltransferase [Planctomycetota bacterium]
MNDVVEVNEIDALRSYHLAWTALHAETPRASFFQTFEWLENYWRHRGEGQRLRVLIVRANGRPLGIVPLVERTERSRLGPVRVLTYPLDNWGSNFGPIGPSRTATLALAMKHLASTPRTWDVFAPRWTLHDTVDRGRTEHAMRLAGLPATVESQSTTSLIEFGAFADWDAYLRSRSTKTRHEVRRQRRRLERQHHVEFVRFRPEALRHGNGDPHWTAYAQCLAIAEKSWQASSADGNTLSNDSVAPLLVDAHQQAARLGMLDMSLLLLDGQPAAYYYGYHCDGEVVGLRTGYDPDATGGTGSVLIGHLIEDSFARGDTRLDLGVGTQQYKRRLRTNVEKTSRLTHIARGAWRPQALRAARWCKKRLRVAG